jgi:hypothetical protein
MVEGGQLGDTRQRPRLGLAIGIAFGIFAVLGTIGGVVFVAYRWVDTQIVKVEKMRAAASAFASAERQLRKSVVTDVALAPLPRPMCRKTQGFACYRDTST